jgi:hypothetical protein
MPRISTERPSSLWRFSRARRRHLVFSCAALTLSTAAVTLASCGRTQSRISRRVPTKSEAGELITAGNEFKQALSVRVPRAIAIEPKAGDGAVQAFAASLGRDIFAVEALRSLAPAVVTLQDALLLRVDDSPISDQVSVDAPIDMSWRANALTLPVPSKHRYWRHYLRIEPVDLRSEEWVSETGGDEIDETNTMARVVRSPGWRAIVARRELVGVDSVHSAGDTLSIAYRWHWVPSGIGKPFMSRDTLAVDRVATNDVDAPLLSPSARRATATFVRTADGWVARSAPVATRATTMPNPTENEGRR